MPAAGQPAVDEDQRCAREAPVPGQHRSPHLLGRRTLSKYQSDAWSIVCDSLGRAPRAELCASSERHPDLGGERTLLLEAPAIRRQPPYAKLITRFSRRNRANSSHARALSATYRLYGSAIAIGAVGKGRAFPMCSALIPHSTLNCLSRPARDRRRRDQPRTTRHLRGMSFGGQRAGHRRWVRRTRARTSSPPDEATSPAGAESS
jgi:hypothetical protein